MEDLLRKLSEDFPDEAPIRPSKYIPDCLVGKTRVWKNGNETITATDALYPSGALALYLRDTTSQPVETSWSARIWNIASRATMFTVGMGSKFFVSGINTTRIHGTENLQKALSRPLDKPLITLFNHNSCFDDPGLMGAILSTKQLADFRGMRWCLSATEVIFLNRWMSTFWALGKVVPVTRGWGPRQPAIDFLVHRLNEGSWVNIFPEAKVIDSQFQGLFRWGVGRLVMEPTLSPLILPVYHIGMNSILPNPKPGEDQSVLIRPGNLVTVCIGEPIELNVERDKWKSDKPEDSWSKVTRELQTVMKELEQVARTQHRLNIIEWLKRWHDSRDVYSYLIT